MHNFLVIYHAFFLLAEFKIRTLVFLIMVKLLIWILLIIYILCAFLKFVVIIMIVIV